MFRTLRSTCTLLVLIAVALTFQSLTAPSTTAQVITGTPPFGSFGGGPDVINLANLNAHLTVPILHKPGRGLNLNFDLNYDSSVWIPVTSSGTTSWQPATAWGWSSSAFKIGNITNSLTISYTTCYDQHHIPHTETTWRYTNWAYTDAFGTRHTFGNSSARWQGCTSGSNGFTAEPAWDGSGYSLTTNGGGGSLYGSDGSLINAPTNNPAASGSATDRNGNQITYNSGTGVFTDTLGSTALTEAGSAPNVTYTYTSASGNPAVNTVSYVSYTVATNFAVSGINEYGAQPVNLVDRITLPDNTFYQFAYEQTPSTPSSGQCIPLTGTYQPNCVTARIWKVTLPTGGQIIYTYSGGASTYSSGIWNDGSTATLQRQTPDGTWTYAQVKGTTAPASTTTVQDPQGNNTVIQFQGIYETERQAYQGSSTLLSTVDTCYNGATIPCAATAISLPILSRSVQPTIPSAGSTTLVSKTVTTYNNVGGPTEIDTYAFGSGSAPTTPTRKTLITYGSLGNITAFRQSVAIQNGSGTGLAQTNYNYDETTPVAAPTGTPQLTSVSGSRGNLTSVQQCAVSCPPFSSYLTTTMTYDTAGQLLTAKDPLNYQTTFSYTDNFLDDDGSNPPSHAHTALGYPTDAFITSITPPLNGAITMKYYFYNGQVAQTTDQNGQASFGHFDSIGRPTSSYGPQVSYPGGTGRPWSLLSYTSNTQLDSFLGIDDPTAAISCGACRHDHVNVDSLGRPVTQQLVSDPEGATSVDTTFDSRGQVKTVSHPHRSTSSLTDGLETPTYDAAGRTISVTHPDNTASHTYYGPTVTAAGGIATQLCASGTYGLGFPTLFVDESTSRKRQTWTDGYGRTIEGDEPDGTGALASAACYSYDPLGNLLQVTHTPTPTQTRTYAYDPLSRVTSVTIPERTNSAGTNCLITFTYDNNSNIKTKTIPAPNQNASCSTGAVTITYSYDQLNRLTGKTYSDSSPAVKYGYDAVALTGCATTTPPALTDSNPKGRMTSMCDSSGATSWAHDALGKILTEKRTINSNPSPVTETISYVYNLDGSPATVTYPSGKTVTYTVSNAQRLTAANDTTSGTQFALVASYAPTGALQGMITGQISGGFGGVTESHAYNNSLEYTSTQATSTVGTAMNLTLNHSLTGGDNGSVTTITNNVDTNRTQTLTYDPLNRILSAKSSATSGPDCWGQVFGPDGAAADDSVANMTKINSGTQTQPPCPLGMLSATVDANNHINTDSTYASDAVGNMTKDGSGTTYTFDDEGRLTLASGPSGGPYCYVYDGNGLRVAKKSGASSCASGTVTRLYWRSISGDSLAETDATGVTNNSAYNEYVFFAGRRIASRTGAASGTGPIFYYFADQLGTTRTITTGNGTGQTPGQLCYDADFTPYGQEIQYTARLQTTACPPNYRFTGYEYDSETGLNYALARYYSPRLGRFLSTDPLGGSVGNLQSHNAYAYVLNNPLSYVDPTGLTCYQIVDDPYGGTYNQEVPLNHGDCDKAKFEWLDDYTTVTVTDDGGGGSSGSPLGGCASFYENGAYIGNICDSTPKISSGGGANKGTPWYKNSCITGAIGSGLLHVGVDAIGLIPEGGLVSRAVGNYAGYRGIVATQQGTKALQAVKMGAGIGSAGTGSDDTSLVGLGQTATGVASIAATLASATPVVGQILSGVSIGLDILHAGIEIANCQKQ